ncbi:condensation domain-containing protein [Actinoplanes sp. RD1]|uniref:condensation domain-containing protein n=1 Tax=Actinoplanes sp. RD1 TaxID=3064538 RepID=UPI0027406A6F|nr:condensation domain-containing protein [Actinoplanes sp. RD1]
MLVSTPAALSYAQERLWLIDAADPGAATYNVPVLLRWRERADPAALARALTAVAGRHETLRTVYRVRDDEPVQLALPPAPVPVRVIEATGASWADVRDDALAEGRAPIDLAAGPVLRAAVWTGLTGGDAVLIVVHHIAFDGWSMGRFCTDLAHAYEAVAAGRDPELAAPGPGYAAFAGRDRAAAQSGEAREAARKRAEALLGAGPALDLAGALPRTPGRRVVRPGGEALAALPAELWSRVAEVAAARRVTPFVVLAGAFEVLLARWSGREEFRLGVISANRDDPALEDTVGFFVNTVPLLAEVRPGETFAQHCRRARGEAFRIPVHQRIPYDRLTQEARTELVEVAFALQNFPVPPPGTPVRWGVPEILPTGTAKFELMLTVEERDSGWWARLEYDTARYPRPVAELLVAAYAGLLDTLTADPEVLVGQAEVPVPSPEAAPRAEAPVPARAGDARTAEAAELFAAVLADRPAATLGPDADFFALGGYSLLVVKLLRHVERTHGRSLLARDFLADPTVAGLGALLAAAPAPAVLPAAGPDEQVPTSSAQQRFWSIDRLPWLRTAYLVPTVAVIGAGADPGRLREAVRTVLGRHPALRSRFTLDRRRRTVFYRTDAPEPEVTVVDAAARADDELWRTVGELSWTGFDLARDAPARATLLTRADGSVVLVVVAHHIAFDGWSRRIVLEQIGAAYRGVPLPEPVHPAEAGHVPDAVASAHTEAVIAALAGAPVDPALPRDHPRAPEQQTLGATVGEALGPDRTRRLRAIAAGAGCTTFMLTAALYAVAVARLGGARDVVLALPYSQRTGARSEHAVGMYVDTLTVRLDLRSRPTWQELLAQARAACAATFRHSAARFDAVAAAVDPDRDLSRPPLTPLYLDAQDAELPAPDLGDGIPATVRPLAPLHVKYELELTVTDHRDDIVVGLAYAAALFEPGTATAILRAVVAAADDLAADPGARPLEEK